MYGFTKKQGNIDNGAVEQVEWSGEQDWLVATYTFALGVHTFKWAYTKDGSASVGSDRAWIDAITIYPSL